VNGVGGYLFNMSFRSAFGGEESRDSSPDSYQDVTRLHFPPTLHSGRASISDGQALLTLSFKLLAAYCSLHTSSLSGLVV